MYKVLNISNLILIIINTDFIIIKTVFKKYLLSFFYDVYDIFIKSYLKIKNYRNFFSKANIKYYILIKKQIWKKLKSNKN